MSDYFTKNTWVKFFVIIAILDVVAYSLNYAFENSWLSSETLAVIFNLSSALTFLSYVCSIFFIGFSVSFIMRHLWKAKGASLDITKQESPVPFIPALAFHSFICFALAMGAGMMSDSGTPEAYTLSSVMLTMVYVYFLLGISCMIYGNHIKSTKVRTLPFFFAFHLFIGGLAIQLIMFLYMIIFLALN